MAVELGHPTQAPLSLKYTTPLLKFSNIMSPPSLATAGLTFSSITFSIFTEIWSFFSFPESVFISFFSIKTLLDEI